MIEFSGTLQKLEVKPGDVFVLSCDQRLNSEISTQINQKWKTVFPDNKLIVLDKNATLEVFETKQKEL